MSVSDDLKSSRNSIRNSLFGKRVLVADGDPVNRQLAMIALQASGIETKGVRNGRLALKAMQSESFDAVLMSCQLPVMDGFETACQMRLLSDSEQLPIIAFSESVSPEIELRCKTAGIDQLLTKPLQDKLLYDTLEMFICGTNTEDGEVPEQGQALAAEEQILEAAGLDVRFGLSMTSQNRQTYINLLKVFVERHENDGALLRELPLDSPLETRLRIPHALKGMAGSLGATAIQEIATRTQKALRNGELIDLASVGLQLSAEFEKLSAAVAQARQIAETSPSDAGALPLDQVQVELDEILSLLRTFDVESIRRCESLASQLDASAEQAFAPVLNAARTFDFDAAAGALSSLAIAGREALKSP